MELDVTGWMIEWRGPALFWFLPISDDDSAMIDELKPIAHLRLGLHPRHVPPRPYGVHHLDHAEERRVPDPAEGQGTEGRGCHPTPRSPSTW